LLREAARPVLTTIGTRGYGRTGIGSEIAIGEGVIGGAAATLHPVKISDLSRVRRFSAAITLSTVEEARSIPLPGLDGAMSQLAVPIQFHKRLVGVVLIESRNRLAFGREAEVLVEVVARLAGAAIAYSDAAGASEAAPITAPPVAPQLGPSFKVLHHNFDDSIFIEDSYVIKGVAGRLLILILELHLKQGRTDFTNRELRLNEAMRLPDFKDNLETRLLLLRRRLEEKQAPVRLVHVGRGQLRLDLQGRPAIQHV
ncbi:MAG: GAF domain-containing protein, partial [bacterium]